MNVLITGGAGFIGRWVVNKFLLEKHNVWVMDNLSNGDKQNLEEFSEFSNYHGLIEEDIMNIESLENSFEDNFDLCIHLAAQINVQESLDNPETAFNVNVVGTYNLLNFALKSRTKMVIMGTCMVYDIAQNSKPINEEHPVKPLSPYAASKLSAENFGLSYYHGYDLPVVILRPFNVYGPHQKNNMEGGVVSIFISRDLKGEVLEVFGDGTQTRDLLYVEDCADFIYKASFEDKAVGEVINAGLGADISINNLASLIAKDPNKIKHVKHIHPQSEIDKLLCDYSKAKRLLGWEPSVSLEEGIKKTEEWFRNKLD
jgi:nucleoside-diphosphate-sugar epimerase